MKPYLPSLITCVILFIFVFLPWLRVDMGSYIYTENGLNDWGYLVLVMSIIGAGVSFISVPKTRSLGTILTGILAIIGAAVYWSRLQGAGAGYGLIIALIASLALIAFGYAEYRKLIQAEKPEPPAKTNPPAPPPTQ
jgi:uncharacterized membrane protein (UPF0136 family)